MEEEKKGNRRRGKKQPTLGREGRRDGSRTLSLIFLLVGGGGQEENKLNSALSSSIPKEKERKYMGEKKKGLPLLRLLIVFGKRGGIGEKGEGEKGTEHCFNTQNFHWGEKGSALSLIN